MTPLIYAAREGRVDVIAMLVEYGADVDKQDSRGYTVSFIAINWKISSTFSSFICTDEVVNTNV
jgi:ankyrin repeat protein